MGLGTKNRQKQTADICKQHLREKYRDKLRLVTGRLTAFARTLWIEPFKVIGNVAVFQHLAKLPKKEFRLP